MFTASDRDIMSKKRSSSPGAAAAHAVPPFKKTTQARQNASQSEDSEGAGEFEDLWEDEFELEDVVNGDESDVEDAEQAIDRMSLDGTEEGEGGPLPYLPQLGQGSKDLDKGEELVPDLSSYVMLHHARLAWPCLSFDVLRDTHEAHRMKPPHSACVVAGTQAAETEADANEVVVMRWDNLTRVKRNPGKLGRDLSDSEEEDSEDEDEDQAPEDDATLVFRSIPHQGGVNRIRAQALGDLSAPPPEPPSSYLAATFSETGKVHIYDIAPHLHSLLAPATHSGASLAKKPLHTITAHGRAEGFALAWSPPLGTQSTPRLLSGDIHSKIYLSTINSDGITTSKPYSSHTSSVEDLQWSPSESTVFASCSADCSLRIWDTRVKDRKSVIAVDRAHESDVNVLSWNTGTSYLMLTGGDEGGLKVWDMRNMKSARSSKPSPVAAFTWHTEPITSVEWHPTDDSCFVASGADHQVTQWDLSVELDDEEQPNGHVQGDKSQDVPPQLLFAHQGQQDVKEVHWHPQIPGCVISTAATGFDIFKSISI